MIRVISLCAVVMSMPAVAQPITQSAAPVSEPATEGVRLRGGFSFNGGGGFGVASGGTAAFAARVGVQFNRWFSTYYQPQPIVFFAGSEQGVAVGFVLANSLLANFTVGDFLDLGVGPSLDYSALAGCSADAACEASKGLEVGVHGRLALNLGSRNTSGSRSGFSIGLDVHPLFTPAGPFFLATLGVGGEWF